MGKILTKIERFRVENGLTKKQLAAYLGVSDVFIGKVCKGIYKMPEKHFVQLLNNDQGWDVSTLMSANEEEVSVDPADIPRLFANKEGFELIEEMRNTLRAVMDTQASIIASIKAKDEQIASMMDIIKNLTQK